MQSRYYKYIAIILFTIAGIATYGGLKDVVLVILNQPEGFSYYVVALMFFLPFCITVPFLIVGFILWRKAKKQELKFTE